MEMDAENPNLNISEQLRANLKADTDLQFKAHKFAKANPFHI